MRDAAKRSWFNHGMEAPLSAGARRAVEELTTELADGPLSAGRRRQILDGAREAVARFLRVRPEDVVLTSGATEASNLAIKGVARGSRVRRLVGSVVEQMAILHPLHSLERDGYQVSLVAVDRKGRVDLDALEHELAGGAALLSAQLANPEIGTVQPAEEIGRLARRYGVPWHADAVASAGLRPVPTGERGADLISLSGARLGAPSGTGALWVRPGIRLLPLIEGGTQEEGRRAGGENLLGAAALGAALQEAAGREQERAQATRVLRDRLEASLRCVLPDLERNGPASGDASLPGHLPVSFPGVEGEALLLRLARAGVEASSGSACASEAGKPSHVLQAIGLSPERAHRSVLFCLGPASRAAEVMHAEEAVPAAVRALRRISGHPGG